MRGTGGQFMMLVVMNALLLVAGVFISGGSFLSLFNLQSMAGPVPEIGLLAIGVMLATRAAITSMNDVLNYKIAGRIGAQPSRKRSIASRS